MPMFLKNNLFNANFGLFGWKSNMTIFCKFLKLMYLTEESSQHLIPKTMLFGTFMPNKNPKSPN